MSLAATARRPRFSMKYDPRGRHARSRKSMGEMNVTPFIDVLLVLLVMLILAVPIQVHQTSVDLPAKPDDTAKFEILEENTVFITPDDQVLWNGNPVTPDELAAQVAAASVGEVEQHPMLRFEPAALASYDTSARTLTTIRESGAKRFAFIGNERHKDFN